MALGETCLMDLDAALSGSSWMSQALPTCAAAASHSVEALYINPFCVGAGKLTLEPGALDITGLEPSNPFALALGLSSLCHHAGTHGYWNCACTSENSSNIYLIFVNNKQSSPAVPPTVPQQSPNSPPVKDCWGTAGTAG